jgi:hypothetical protein
MDIVSNRPAVSRWLVLAAALLALNLSLTFANDWPTLFIRFTGAVSAEVAVLILIMAISTSWLGPPSRAILRTFAVLWVLLVVGRYIDVTMRSLFGRELNLYWDLRYIPDVSAMLAFVTRPWLIAAILAGAGLLPLLLYASSRWALGRVSEATNDRRARVVLVVLASAILLSGAAQRVNARVPAVPEIAAPVTPVYFAQFRRLAYELSGAGMEALPAAVPIRSDLARLGGADVFLVFIESYGEVSWDRPAFASALAPSRMRLEADIRDTGRHVVSGRVESPIFGGGSWLAHISLLSGMEVRDQDTNVRLMAQQRDTMVTAFSRQGYRTIAVMPGLQRAWPEGRRFYGFDEVYGTTELDYHGPSFGWWDVTDQFALARFDALSSSPSRQPLFVFFPTISTHMPFAPTPPYQPDWKQILNEIPYGEEELARAWSDSEPDWLNLGPSYVQALDYTQRTLGGYLRLHPTRDMVMILIGDHQPPAAVTGEGASWGVPIHVIASRREILDRLTARGFREGLTPTPAPLMKIHALLPVILETFGS